MPNLPESPRPLSPRRVLVPLGIGIGISLLGDSTLYTVLPHPAIAAQLGISLTMVGILLGFNRLARILFNGPIGMLYTRQPRRKLMIASLFIGAISTVCYAFGQYIALFIFGRFLWGAAWSGIWIGGNTMILDMATDQNRGRLSARYQMWFFIGIAASTILGAGFTDWLGFRCGLLLSAGLSLLAVLMWLLFLPETKPEATIPQKPTQTSSPFPWRAVLHTSIPLFIMRITFAGVLASTSILWLSDFIGEELALQWVTLPLVTLTGLLVAARTLMSMAGAPAAGALSDRLGHRWLTIAIAALLGASGLWLMGGSRFPSAIAGMLLAAATAGSISTLTPALIGDQAGQEQHSRSLGVVFTIGDLGSALGPPLALGLLPLLSLSGIYRICSGLFLGVGVLAFLFSRHETNTMG